MQGQWFNAIHRVHFISCHMNYIPGATYETELTKLDNRFYE